MASGAAPCSDQRSSAKAADKAPPGNRGRKLAADGGRALHCEICVVCGDRACNHHYYGVAACHGCKCFFWRSIKNKMKYICRGDSQCDLINPNHRNSCRFCRLQRCLKAGMQPESVRMPKEGVNNASRQIAILEQCLKGSTKEAQGLRHKWAKSALSSADVAHCPLCHQSPPIVAAAPFPPNAENGKAQIGAELSKQLVRKLVEIETTINEVADFSENEAPKCQLGLDSLFTCPELLDRFRTQVNYCIRLRRVTEDELEFCKYRTLAKTVDYIRALSLLEAKYVQGTEMQQQQNANANGNDLDERLNVHDKIILLRHCFAPLALFDISAGTSFTTKDTQNLLCLPTGLTVCANEEILPNGFLSQQIVGRCVSSLVRVLTELCLDQEEFVMVKLIIVLTMDSNGIGDDLSEDQQNPSPRGNLLSTSGQNFVERLRDNVHAALYNHCPKRVPPFSPLATSDAALRFAKLLHILPKLMLLSRDLVEHIRMVHTFPTTSSRPTDPLFFEMFGDIFHENQGRSAAGGFDGWSPVGSSAATTPTAAVPSPQPQRLGTIAAGHAEGATAAAKMISSAQPFKAEFDASSPSPPPRHQQQQIHYRRNQQLYHHQQSLLPHQQMAAATQNNNNNNNDKMDDNRQQISAQNWPR